MPWERLPVLPTFEKARRREIYGRIARLVRGDADERDLLSLEEVQDRLGLFEQHYIGIEPIRVANIIGTVDRSREFDRDFLPRDFETRARWRAIEHTFRDSAFPPIVVYKVGDAYFVVDGHHRVAVAKQREVEFIDAEITELETKSPLPPGARISDVIHAQQAQMFLDQSGLGRARPEARVELSRAEGYVELLELVKVHGYHLMKERNQVLSDQEIASDWYDRVYLPAVVTIRSEALEDAFPHATAGDLFLWVAQRRRTLFPQRGALTFEEAARSAKPQDKR